MTTPVQRSKVRYSVRRADGAGWTVWEDDQPIAFCTSEAYARAIANSLNTYRALVSGKLLFIQPPASHYLN